MATPMTMRRKRTGTRRGQPGSAAGLPRLLPGPGPEDLRAHLARYGAAPYRGGPAC